MRVLVGFDTDESRSLIRQPRKLRPGRWSSAGMFGEASGAAAYPSCETSHIHMSRRGRHNARTLVVPDHISALQHHTHHSSSAVSGVRSLYAGRHRWAWHHKYRGDVW
jgi:hypothetical protein